MAQTEELEKVDPFIENELAKFEIKEEDLRALVKSTEGLLICGLEDKEGYQKVHKARMSLVKARTSITAAGKAMRAKAIAFNKAILAREDKFVDIVVLREKELERIQDDIDELKEKFRIEAEEREDRRIQGMSDQLSAVGHAADYISLKGMTDEQFAETLAEATSTYEKRMVQEQAERDQLAKDKADREAAQNKLAEDNERESRRLSELKKEQEQKAAEIKVMREKIEQDRLEIQQAKLAARKQRMFDLGFKWDGTKYGHLGLRVGLEIVNESEDQVFNTFCEDWVELIAKLNKQEKVDADARAEELRLKGIQDEKNRQEKARLDKEESDRKAKEEEEERLAAAPDRDKMKRVLLSLASIEIPEMKSKRFKTAINGLRGELEQIQFNYKALVEDKKLQ